MKTLIPIFKDNINIHFFDNISIIQKWEPERIELFSEAETDIIELIDGKKTIVTIQEMINRLYKVDPQYINSTNEKILLFITALNQSSYIDLIETSKSSSCKITGKRKKCYPRSITLELTDQCNLHCEHCYKEAKNTKGIFIALKQIETLINQVEDNIFDIQLTGGEPFLHPQINEILKTIVEHYYILVTTNGTLLSNVDESLLKKINFIQVSMYGATSKEYESMTGSQSAFKNFLYGLEKICTLRINNRVSVVLNKENMYKAEEYIKLAAFYGISEIKFGLPYLRGRALDNKRRWYFEKEEEHNIHKILMELNIKYKNKINVVVWNNEEENYNQYNIMKEYVKHIKMYKSFSCGAGSFSLAISEEGKVRACTFFPKNICTICDVEQMKSLINDEYEFNIKEVAAGFIDPISKFGVNSLGMCTPLKDLQSDLLSKPNKLDI